MKIFFLFFLILSTAVNSSASTEKGENLFKRMCFICHPLQRALAKSKDLDGWKRTTKRMSRYSGNVITPENAEAIAEYLATRPPPDGTMYSEQYRFRNRKIWVKQFIDPEVCMECHTDIYDQWNGSMHNKAFKDPLWRGAVKLFAKGTKTRSEIMALRSCVKCHIPLGFRSDSVTYPTQDFDSADNLSAQGIFCNWCHSISEVKHLGDADYEVAPGGGDTDPSTMLGPLEDADSDFHPTQYSELHTTSEFCALCHDVSHSSNGLPLERTYTEWKNSPYNTENPATTTTCQDCHMRQRPGVPSTGKTERPDFPGRAAKNGPEREHVWSHYFVGANAMAATIMGNELHADMARERLQNAADLTIVKGKNNNRGELARLMIKVENSGAGHYLPTGMSEVREMWLDVTISDADGNVLLRSGELDGNGDIDEEAAIFKTVLGNEKGEPETNIAAADRVLSDYRIPPKGHVAVRYSFNIPENAVSPLTIEATLKYRSISPAMARDFLGYDDEEIPVIDMTKAVETIDF